MGVFDRGIRGNVQSPFTALGAADSIGYVNPRLPQAFGGNVQLAIDYVLAFMYPAYKGTVPTKADLPVTATQNDYYVVTDDGDGKSAGYVYTIVDGVTSWAKRYDLDYNAEGLLAEAIQKTSYMYPAKYGSTDLASDGTPITGLFAGQRIYGGDKAGQNLTFNANAKDALGFIQFDNTLRATTDNAFDLGDSTYRFRNALLGGQLTVGTTTLAPAVLNDSSGSFSFSALNVSTTGTLVTGKATHDTTLKLESGKISDTTGAISFLANNLSTTGTFTAATGSKLADFTFTNGKINTLSTAIDLSSKNLASVGNIASSGTVTCTEVDVGSLVLNGVVVRTLAGSTLILQGGAGGSGTSILLNSATTVQADFTVNGNFQASSITSLNGLMAGTSAKVSTTSTNARFEAQTGNLQLVSANVVSIFSALTPDTTGTRDLGTTTLNFRAAYIQSLSDNTNSVTAATLTSLRDINVGATNGMALYYNGNKWVAQAVNNATIVHNTLAGLTDGDAGHTQFAFLAGRSGGQLLNGGTASGENLTLESTSNATKGLVLASSTFAPTTDSALDLGTSVKQFRHMYSVGLHYGLRFDQYAGSGNYPANASAKIGRVIWDTTINQLLIDNGTTWSKVGNQKWLSDVTADGSTTSYAVNVSAQISDARTGVWQLADNANGFERVYAKMTFTQTQVTITSSPPLPAGSYRLVGFN